MANVQENMSRFQQAIGRARKLTQMDANGSISQVRNKALQEGRMSFSENGVDSTINEGFNKAKVNYQEMPINTQSMQKSKLPKAILESMSKNPINTDLLGVDVGQTSVLDLMQEELKPQMQQKTQHKQVLSENTTIANQNIPSNVDYSLIKTIMEDTVKKYVGALKKSVLNENKTAINENNSLQAMKIGNKFTFIDSKGNIYEAKLQKIGNINENKKTRGN